MHKAFIKLSHSTNSSTSKVSDLSQKMKSLNLFRKRMSNQGEGLAIWIDLGTTYSCVAVWQNERVEIIVNDQGNRTTPSYVAFTPAQSLVGDAAMNRVAKNPTNSVFGNLQSTFSFFLFFFLDFFYSKKFGFLLTNINL